MSIAIQFPERLWDQPLFRASAEYSAETAPLLAAHIDARLRRLRRMPSISDDGAALILEGLDRLWAQAEKWLLQGAAPDPQLAARLGRLDRIKRGIERGMSVEGFQGHLNDLTERLDERARAFVVGLDWSDSEAALSAISLLGRLILERSALSSPRWRKPYLRSVYRIVDGALTYNTTTDAARYAPVLGWVQHVLLKSAVRERAYVDVGCAALAGAPGLVLAARLFREQGVCAPCLHGTDIRLPDRSFVLRLLTEHRIAIYASDPVLRPLPKIYGVMLLANVHRHLTADLQRRLLMNLWSSLVEGGLLFITWRFSATESPGICLERRGNAFVVVHQANVV